MGYTGDFLLLYLIDRSTVHLPQKIRVERYGLPMDTLDSSISMTMVIFMLVPGQLYVIFMKSVLVKISNEYSVMACGRICMLIREGVPKCILWKYIQRYEQNLIY